MIEVSNLTFQYPHQAQPVLQGLSLTIPTGQWLAVVGKNGSGKSTLARLIAGLLPTPAQTIRVNDLPVDEAHLAALHHQIGLFFKTLIINLWGRRLKPTWLWARKSPGASSSNGTTD